MKIRRASGDDVASIIDVAVRAINETGPARYDEDQLATWSHHFTFDSVARMIEQSEMVVAVVDGVVVGFANLLNREDGGGELDLLYVAPQWSSRGFATELVGAVESLARASSFGQVWVDASLFAAPLLARLGYQVVRRYEKTVEGVAFSNAWLRKDLD